MSTQPSLHSRKTSDSYTSHITRRRWLSSMGLCMVSAAVPVGLIGCDEPLPDATGATSDELTPSLHSWVTELEEMSIFRRFEPGMWEGIEGTHLPILTFHNERREATVYTNHVMNEEHWIELQYLRDQDQKLIAAKQYSPQDALARWTFPLPPETTEIFAYSYCNLHGLWNATSTF